MGDACVAPKMPSASFRPSAPPQRRFKVFATNAGAIFGLILLGSLPFGAISAEMSDSSSTDTNFPLQVFWGDTHVHSSLSVDANTLGNATLTPADAYRFASGEAVTATNGMKARIHRPLDFLLVADHAMYFGVAAAERKRDPVKGVTEFARQFFGSDHAGLKARLDLPAIERSAWLEALALAEQANQPGRFTTLLGFEWTSMPDGNNLHRVVMFRDGSQRVGQVQPFSFLDSENVRKLWEYLRDYELKTGGSALAIPHNGNLSNGAMFTETLPGGQPFDSEYNAERLRWEPVIEATQIKGDGETHPLLSPDDEFADYGTWDEGNLAATARKEKSMLRYEYARSALQLGLRQEQRTGSNPYQFGMIGSTDSHTSLATSEEDNFWGKATRFEPGQPMRLTGPFKVFPDPATGKADTYQGPNPALPESSEALVVHSWEQLASGYAAVWASENTREAIFDAVQRREVYATTGPRITVQFFAGWGFREGDETRPDFARHAYQNGVPMGGTLSAGAHQTGAPAFIAAALKDPQGANLDRIQIIKGWLDKDGETLREKVFDVVWSGQRKPDRNGQIPAVGNSVNLQDASYSNSIGAAQLTGAWVDPEFDPAQSAFYYARVLEIPTPRWIVYDEVQTGSRFPDEATRIHQERAYTSPIWYTAEKE